MQDKYSFFTAKTAFTVATEADHTPLHAAISSCTSASEIIHYVTQTNQQHLARMLYTPNKKGLLPIHLIRGLSIAPEEKEALYQCLLPYVKPSVPSLTTPVDLKTICNQYKIQPDSPLYGTVKIACLLVNQIRQTDFLSSTHPDISGKDAEDIELLHREIKDCRNEADRKKYEHLFTDKEVTYQNEEDDEYCSITAHFTPSVRNTLLQTYAEIPLAAKKANCAEFSDIFVHLFNKLNLKNERIELFEISNSDHGFVVLSRDPDSNPAQFKTWGDRALVVDVWAGKIYPATSIPEQLSTFSSMDITLGKATRHYVFIAPFIPGYHTLALDTDVSLVEETVQFKLTPNSYVGEWIKCLNLSLKELFLFHGYIKPLLKELIAEKKLNEYELAELEYPVETLIYTFLDPYYLKKLTHGQVYLKDIEDRHIIDEVPHPTGYEIPELLSPQETSVGQGQLAK
ncbi:hypothetical protein GH742_06635 [Legionella sp. MW5194]|uniref:hypothetical protein n=1 Tax=Legionella sp. MW5194 TaxID=2662448 RepID=UPI00193C88EE|nr:hypothetical protein [Legionella sp. MW5194]QRN03561.1 hypothetical protein GH742_06635 [Legionella sp. MW5194]